MINLFVLKCSENPMTISFLTLLSWCQMWSTFICLVQYFWLFYLFWCHQHLAFCNVAAVYITCICNSPFERVTPTIIAAIVHLVCEILTNFFRLWLIVGHWYFWKFPQISKRQFIKVWSVNNVYVTVYITHYSKS